MRRIEKKERRRNATPTLTSTTTRPSSCLAGPEHQLFLPLLPLLFLEARLTAARCTSRMACGSETWLDVVRPSKLEFQFDRDLTFLGWELQGCQRLLWPGLVECLDQSIECPHVCFLRVDYNRHCLSRIVGSTNIWQNNCFAMWDRLKDICKIEYIYVHMIYMNIYSCVIIFV